MVRSHGCIRLQSALVRLRGLEVFYQLQLLCLVVDLLKIRIYDPTFRTNLLREEDPYELSTSGIDYY